MLFDILGFTCISVIFILIGYNYGRRKGASVDNPVDTYGGDQKEMSLAEWEAEVIILKGLRSEDFGQ